MMQWIAKAAFAVVLAGAVGADARNEEDAAPQQLVIGYDNEGKIDPSPQACLAFVKEVTQWNKPETEKGARDVCAARKRHVAAYAALQASYRSFLKTMAQDRRLSAADAAKNFATMLKACIDHKFNLTTGGHNIMIDVIENDTVTACLVLGTSILRVETRALTRR